MQIRSSSFEEKLQLIKVLFTNNFTYAGCVVNVSSIASLQASPGCVPYSMTKVALDHFTRGFSAGK